MDRASLANLGTPALSKIPTSPNAARGSKGKSAMLTVMIVAKVLAAATAA